MGEFSPSVEVKYFFQSLHGSVWQQTSGVHKKVCHFALPTLIDIASRHTRAGAFKALSLQVTYEHAVIPKEKRVVTPS